MTALFFFSFPFKRYTAVALKYRLSPSLIETILYTGLEKHIFSTEIVIIFLPILLSICLGAQENRLIETVLLSTHNIY